MLNNKLYLKDDLFSKEQKQIATRDGWGDGLVEVGEKYGDVVVLCADLKESTRCFKFEEKYPDRYIEVGVAEQAMATIASGFAAYGKRPFISSYAAFSPGRNWEQIRTTIALNDVPVVIGGAHAGLTVGPDGATHQMLEDIALMRAMPNMTVLVPCDYEETKKAVIEAYKKNKPVYIRFAREKSKEIITKDTPFEIGKSLNFWESKDPIVTIVAAGPVLYESLLAAKELINLGIEVNVLNLSTIKPIDEDAIINAARITGAIVSVEEHQIMGGVGSAVSEVISKNHSVPMEMVGVDDQFGESGKPAELLKKFNITSKNIIEKTKQVILRKTY